MKTMREVILNYCFIFGFAYKVKPSYYIFEALSVIFMLINTWSSVFYLKIIMDFLIADEYLQAIVFSATFPPIIFVFQTLFDLVQYYKAVCEKIINIRMNADLAEKQFKTPFYEFDTYKTKIEYDFAKKAINFTGVNQALEQFGVIISNIVSFVGVIFVFSRLSLWLILILIVIICVNSICSVKKMQYKYNQTEEETADERGLYYARDYLTGPVFAKEARSFGLNNYMAVPETIAAISDDLKHLDCANLHDFELEFKNVSFKYSDSSDYALKDISFKIRNNETISIVGENGAGKTTLAYLILRLFDVTDGEICINGVDIRKYSFSEYRNLIAPVFQNYEIMSYSLRENVIFDKILDENKLQTCYCAAGLLGKVQSLPNGDNTILTKDIYENGEDLSGGEKQKLSIARAYYQDGKILILDEPTSSIDPIAEYNIFKNIKDYNYGKAKIFITHRLTSTAFSDKIIVLDNGRIKQMGTHNQLVHNQGLYKEMYEKQAYYYLK